MAAKPRQKETPVPVRTAGFCLFRAGSGATHAMPRKKVVGSGATHAMSRKKVVGSHSSRTVLRTNLLGRQASRAFCATKSVWQRFPHRFVRSLCAWQPFRSRLDAFGPRASLARTQSTHQKQTITTNLRGLGYGE